MATAEGSPWTVQSEGESAATFTPFVNEVEPESPPPALDTPVATAPIIAEGLLALKLAAVLESLELPQPDASSNVNPIKISNFEKVIRLHCVFSSYFYIIVNEREASASRV